MALRGRPYRTTTDYLGGVESAFAQPFATEGPCARLCLRAGNPDDIAIDGYVANRVSLQKGLKRLVGVRKSLRIAGGYLVLGEREDGVGEQKKYGGSRQTRTRTRHRSTC